MTAGRAAVALLALCLAFAGSAIAGSTDATCDKESGCCNESSADGVGGLGDLAGLTASDSEEAKLAIKSIMDMDSVQRPPEGGIAPEVMEKLTAEGAGLAAAINDKKSCCSGGGSGCCSGGGNACCGSHSVKSMASAFDGASKTLESRCKKKKL